MRLLHKLLGVKTAPPSVSPDSDEAERSGEPAVPAPPAKAPRIKVGWATHVGEVRRHNEDTALVITAAHDGDKVLPPFGLLILADGMGGHQAGEIASSLAARTVAHHILSKLYLPLLVKQEYGTEQPALNEMLVEAVQIANTKVAEEVPGGGTTLTCALLLGSRAYIAHVGDSRAYLVTDDGLDQITHDHSLVDRLVELGQLTRGEAATHPQKNILYRAVGQNGVLEVDTHVRTIPQKARLLLCSDGLWGMMDEKKIVEIVTSAPSLQSACENLVVGANQAGGPDNITVILAEPSED